MKHGITNKGPAKTVSSTAITTAAPPTTAPPAKTANGMHEPDGGGSRRLVQRAKHPLWVVLEVIASLRITVVLFVLSIFLVFYGTWAQVDQGIWTAVDTYFRSYLVFIPLRVLSCRLVDSNVGIPYPGGWLLGTLLMINLLAAHIVRFKISWKRSGILLIHAGLIIMMASEFFTGIYAVEGNMSIRKNQTVNYVEHPREPEIAVVDSSKPKEDFVVVVPGSRIETGKYLSHADLPFDIQIMEFMKNSDEIEFDRAANKANRGRGLKIMIGSKPEIAGTATDQKHDMASAYVNLLDKKSGDSLGIYLLSFWLPPETVEVDGKKYEVSLRFKRTYRDFQLKLVDFRFDRHPGTNRPKNYQSDVILIDPTTKENRKVTISMNNPLRYAGETFYQSSFSPDEQGTVLQVVRNPVWTWPYISCIVVTIGMLIHFGLNLLSFLQKRMEL